MASLHCQSCGAAVTYDEPIPRDAECAACARDLRCCRNCSHYDRAYNNACREAEAEPVEDKARRNFCEFFHFNRAAFAATGTASPAAARAKLDALFGGAPAPPDATRSARAKLDALFGAQPAPDDRKADARRKLDGLFGPPAPDDEL